MGRAGHVAYMLKKRNAYTILLGRRRRRWEDNIKMDLKEIRREIVGLIYLAQDRDK
jgi:hypothetical protein